MRPFIKLAFGIVASTLVTSCVSKKEHDALKSSMQTQLDAANKQLGKCGESLNEYMNKVNACEQSKEQLKGELQTTQKTVQLREEQIKDLKEQVADSRNLRDKQVNQVGELTVLSQSANQNVKETLQQLEKKDKYINILQAAKTKADSINLALAINLKGVLSDGIADKDIDIKVDKTVVFVNLSDKMLYQSGSASLTPKAQQVLQKIAQIIESRPELEVMVEGYTDNVAIRNSCIEDNWDLSVKRATSVIRVLQKNYGINPNRLIAAGRGEYNTLAANDSEAGRAMNRRTRIIILPKLDQFYDLLNPNNVPK